MFFKKKIIAYNKTLTAGWSSIGVDLKMPAAERKFVSGRILGRFYVSEGLTVYLRLDRR